MNIKHITLVSLISLAGLNNMQGQELLSINDSLRLEKVMNDKEGLMGLTSEMGSAVALKAQSRLGFLKFKEKDYEGAKKEFASLKSLRADTKEIREAAYFLGRIASIEKKPESSRAYYEEYLAKEPKGTWREGASYFLIKDMLAVNDSKTLERMKTHLAEFPPDSSYSKHVQYQVVQYYKKSGDYLNAAKEAEVLVAKYPKSSYTEDMNYQIGGFYYKAGRSDMAKSHFKKIVEKNLPGTEPNAIGQYLLAKVYDDDGDYKSARSEYAKVKQNNPNIENWNAVGDYADAISYYKEYQSNPDSQKYVSTEEALKKHIETYPQDKRTPRAIMTLASLYKDNREYEKALEAYGMIESFDASRMKNIVEGYDEKEKEAFNELLYQTKMVKGDLLRIELMHYEEALTAYGEAVNLKGSSHEAILNKGLCLLELGKQDEAKAIFEQAVKENWDEKPAAEAALEQLTSNMGEQ